MTSILIVNICEEICSIVIFDGFLLACLSKKTIQQSRTHHNLKLFRERTDFLMHGIVCGQRAKLMNLPGRHGHAACLIITLLFGGRSLGPTNKQTKSRVLPRFHAPRSISSSCCSYISWCIIIFI